jgi:hypothetical protein
LIGLGLLAVPQWARHEDIQTTMRYVHRASKHDAADKMSALIRSEVEMFPEMFPDSPGSDRAGEALSGHEWPQEN